MTEADNDVVIIGAGIHGCGCAQAAAAAGYSTVVIEQTGIASATSSRSSKLVHGGLRYLESGQFSLVAESLRERELLLRNAPELVKLVPFYIPVYRNSTRRPWQIRLGLALYALLGRFRPATRFRTIKKHEWPPSLNSTNLLSVMQYYDAQTDDAELAGAVMRSAQSLGAELLCPSRFIKAEYNGHGYDISLLYDNRKIQLRSRVLINASGPWINTVLANMHPRPDLLDIELVLGSHIVLEQPSYTGVYYVEAEDGRAVFIMPWKGYTMVGTTERTYMGDPGGAGADSDEMDYLLRTARRYLPDINSTIIEHFAGLRVLPTMPVSAFHRPRDTLLHVTDTLPGMVSIVGGKLTGYRATAEKVMKLVAPFLPETQQKAETRNLGLTVND